MTPGITGSRYAKGCHPDDLWVKYFTSSVHVDIQRWLYGEPDVIEVRRTFNNSLQARDWEEKVLKRMKVVKNEQWLNKTDKPGFPSRLGVKHSQEYRQKMSHSLTGSNHPNFGKHRSLETRIKIGMKQKR